MLRGTSAATWPAPRRGAVVAGVLAAHLLGVILLTTALVPRGRHAPVQPRWFTVTLPAARPSPAAPAPARPERDEVRAPSRPRPVAARPQAITPPTPPAQVATPAVTAAAPGPPDQPAPPPTDSVRPPSPAEPMPALAPPLDLRLPARPARGAPGTAPSMAQQAVQAQVGAIPSRSAEARMAHRLDAEWTVENLGDGRLRMRRGEQCVILKETQASQLDPWNPRGPPPRGAGPCP